MTRSEAQSILESMTKSESLLRHARTVELVMEAMAEKFGKDKEEFAITGILHDADYEAHPDVHPNIIVKQLQGMGYDRIAHAIAGHYTKWNVPRESLLDKCIVAADELTGFIYAVALIRPTKIEGMKVKSVMKKLKTLTFAAKVDREEVYKGAELLEWDIRELVEFIIQVLRQNKIEIGLAADS